GGPHNHKKTNGGASRPKIAQSTPLNFITTVHIRDPMKLRFSLLKLCILLNGLEENGGGRIERLSPFVQKKRGGLEEMNLGLCKYIFIYIIYI
ncbi:hypothetical protein, partial [Salmonella sp. s60131]|uniref:hypothetical protein n=1 Tax=Salmonella sp. s60131 TaxID=3159722 RepID=UPI0039810B34